MKKLCVGLLTIVFALSFASCSTNENELEAPQQSLLKSYKLKRDANGAYSIDYNVAENTNSITHKNYTSSTNEIHLSKTAVDSKDKYREVFPLENNKLKIGFFDAETGKRSSLSIEDENITFARGNSNNGNFLKTYDLTLDEDGSIQLDFEVNSNIVTDFVYNEDLEIYEIHLSKGTSSEKVFSRSIEVPDNGILKIDFVNHKFSGRGTSDVVEKKPRVVLDGNSYASSSY